MLGFGMKSRVRYKQAKILLVLLLDLDFRRGCKFPSEEGLLN